MKEIILNTSNNHKVAINHYNSGRECVLVICPGWHMTKDSKYFKAMSEDFYKTFDVITMDFRGHGKSSGFYTFSAKETEDLQIVVEYAKTRHKEINLLGFSLGAATTIIYAEKYKNANSIIAVSPPVDFNKIENYFFKKEAVMPTLQKFELFRSLSIRPGNIFLEKVKPIDVVDKISPIPVLFIAGSKDPTVYPWHAETLFNKAGNPKHFELFENDFHAEDLYINSKKRFLNLCNEWLKEFQGKEPEPAVNINEQLYYK